MYRSDLSNRDRSGALIAVAAIHAALLFMLLHLSGKLDRADPQSALQLFDLSAPPPPAPPPPKQQRTAARPPDKAGGSAPRNIKGEATPVAAPKPRLVTPPLPALAATQTPRQGSAPAQGASDVRGPGTGAGGAGTGTGSGLGGSGPGGGGDNGVAEPPRLLTSVLGGRDFPGRVLDSWPRGAQILLRLRIDSRGLVSECIIDRASGSGMVDSTICNLVHDRFRFRPAMNRAGQPVAGWFGYRQTAPR